jgi:hypothetical protein
MFLSLLVFAVYVVFGRSIDDAALSAATFGWWWYAVWTGLIAIGAGVVMAIGAFGLVVGKGDEKTYSGAALLLSPVLGFILALRSLAGVVAAQLILNAHTVGAEGGHVWNTKMLVVAGVIAAFLVLSGRSGYNFNSDKSKG